jgi:catechol 2,3-dioxygenase-like lactoylglutathione lyase family enzyme
LAALAFLREDNMESVIAGLLKDFEDGKMTRRQLIQSLALAAVAAAPGASALAQTAAAQPKPPIPQAFEPTGWKTVWLDHISFQVSDYRRSAAFYRDLMGWTIRNDNGTSQATLNINGLGGIIVRNGRAPNPQAAAGAAQPAAGGAAPPAAGAQGGGRGNRPPLTGVINHISWGVQPWDTDKVKAELEKRGLNPRPDMVGENFKSFHVYDPDGWDLQISNQTKESRETVGD